MIFWLSHAKAQNLIPDGSFEEIECPDNSINSISDEDPWFVTGADAYLIRVDCPYDPVASQSVAALRDYTPYRGFAHISLESGMTRSGFIFAEGMTAALTTPLKNSSYYYFDMAYMNYEPVVPFGLEEEACDPMPGRALHVLFGNERIFLTTESRATLEGFIVEDLVTNGRRTLSVDRPLDPNFGFNRWNTYWNCFEARGDESYIAITGEYRKVEPPINCYNPDSVGMIYFTGQAIDETRLVEIPEEIDSIYSICEGKSTEVDLVALANGPYADKATYLWADGSENPVRLLSEEGLYEAEMILPCVTVPMLITIEETRCEADIYVANVFTPNGDGQNDRLLPSIKSELPISSFSFTIFNCWGSPVFETVDQLDAWDGRVNGREAASGVFTWIIKYTLEGEQEELVEVGEVLRM